MSNLQFASWLTSLLFPVGWMAASKRRWMLVVSSWARTESMIVLPEPRTPTRPMRGLSAVKVEGQGVWHTGHTRVVGPRQSGQRKGRWR